MQGLGAAFDITAHVLDRQIDIEDRDHRRGNSASAHGRRRFPSSIRYTIEDRSLELGIVWA
jgi:hypothetical protein